MKMEKLSIIIPAYNAERHIENTLLQYLKFFPNAEFIVVIDGTDNTTKIVRNLQKGRKNLTSLLYPRRLGKGRAILEGAKVAKGNLVGFVDADNSTTPQNFKKLLEEINEFDGVIASRKMKKSKTIGMPLKRQIMSNIFSILVKIFFNLPFRDTQCGAKIFRRDVFLVLLNRLWCKGFAFDVELLWKAIRSGYKIKEVPIRWVYSKGSKINFRAVLDMFFDLFKLKLRSVL